MVKRIVAPCLSLFVLLAIPAFASENPPSINSSGFSNHHVTIEWRGSDQYGAFNIRYSLGSPGAIPTWQSQVEGGYGGSFIWLPPSPGTYVFAVEGCNQDSLGIFHSDCSHWSNQVSVVVPQEPPPQNKTLNWGPMSSGDCRMQNANVTFNSYGGGSFTAQVKTDHTYSGDTWHATISPLNASGQPLLSLGTFDSTRMSDDHGWYNWTKTFTYDQSQFSGIVRADIHNSC